MTNLTFWARRHGVSAEALAELRMYMGVIQPGVKVDAAQGTEARSQQLIRLEAPKHGVALFRNNNGATIDETGRQIRYGLANDSAAMNKVIKSHDLIGITPITITPEHIGAVLGVFTSFEVKRPGWVFKGTPREQAQLKWAELITSLGGISKFATGPEDITWT